jgi:polar amino acid transport system substrate-binding protein
MRKTILFALFACTLFISCSKKNEKITGISQLSNKRICILTGSAGDIGARKAFPQARFIDMVNSTDASLAVKTGKADAFVYDKSVLVKIVEKNDDLVILDEPVSKLELAAAIKKENTTLVTEISAAINELRIKGILDSLKKKWVDTKYQSAPLLPDAAGYTANGTLKMGTCAIYEPFGFISNGKLTGLDIELSRLIGKLLGKNIEIVDMGFDGLIPALQAGKIDFALSDFNVTEERKKLISFSVPYLVNDISALVKKIKD